MYIYSRSAEDSAGKGRAAHQSGASVGIRRPGWCDPGRRACARGHLAGGQGDGDGTGRQPGQGEPRSPASRGSERAFERRVPCLLPQANWPACAEWWRS